MLLLISLLCVCFIHMHCFLVDDNPAGQFPLQLEAIGVAMEVD